LDGTVTVYDFLQIASERALSIETDRFASVEVCGLDAPSLVDLIEECGLFILGIEGFLKYDSKTYPDLALLLDQSRLYGELRAQGAARRDAATLAAQEARRFLRRVPPDPRRVFDFTVDSSDRDWP
jgi:hypothetical protein